MTDTPSSKVFMFDNSDPEMQHAYQRARETFRYFWREVAWERRRIVPGLDVACVKAPFSDDNRQTTPGESPEVEHMWIGNVDFDGRFVSGSLLNAPNWLKSLKKDDPVCVGLRDISDWMYVIRGEVYGAHTVNLMRSQMGGPERNEHDRAWGLSFGDPTNIRLVPLQKKSGGLLKSLFGKSRAMDGDEHPMSEGMALKLKEQLVQEPSMANVSDDQGWTLLHHEALAGNTATVQVLLDVGANPKAVTKDGATPSQLAASLGWEKIVALLASQAAK